MKLIKCHVTLSPTFTTHT